MGSERPASRFFVRARAYMSLIASAVVLAAALPAFAADSRSNAELAKAIWAPAEREAATKELLSRGVANVPALLPLNPVRNKPLMAVLLKLGDGIVPVLLSKLSDPELKAPAADVLFAAIRPNDPKFVPELIACTRKAETARPCGTALVKAAGPKSKGHVASLRAALKDASAETRAFAAGALGQIGPKADEALLDLVAGLKDRDALVRMSCAAALGKLGRAAKAAKPELEKATDDSDSEVQTAAREALRRLDS